MVWVESDLDLRHNLVEKSHSQGIRVDVSSGSPVVNRNDIVGNGDYGLFNARASSDTINAENNWWGDSSGPSHSTNSDGTGNAVSDGVDFDPWLFEPAGALLTQPTGLAAEAGDQKVTLTWESNTESDLSSYRIYRETASNPTDQLTTVTAGNASYTDTEVTNNTTYYYRITAVDEDGNESAYSEQVSATPNPDPLYGDVTDNGDVSSLDGARVLQHVVGKTGAAILPLGGRDSVRADVSEDANIQAFDAALIFRYAADLISCFPVDQECPKDRRAQPALAASEALSWTRVETDSQTVRLRVRLETEKDVYAVQLESWHEIDGVQLRDVRTEVPSDWQVVQRSESDNTALAFAGNSSLSSGPVATLVYSPPENEGAKEQLRAKGAVNAESSQPLEAVTVGTQPEQLTLEPNYPNPFVKSTNIEFALPRASEVQLNVHDVLGRRVVTLMEGRQNAGIHHLQWSAEDDSGARVSSGVYFLVLQAEGERLVRRMSIVR